MSKRRKTIYTILQFSAEHDRFTFEELEAAIEKNGGIMQLGPGWKVVDFLADMEAHGEIRRDLNGGYELVTLSGK